MGNLNYILLEKINLLLKQYFKDQKVSEVLDGFETKPIPNYRIEQRMIIDRAITFAKKELEGDDYSKFQLEIVKVLAEGDNLNMAEEILLTSISEDHSELYYAESLLAMADILLRKSFWSNSNNLIDEAKEVFTKLDNKIGLAKCENLYGTSYGERGEVQLAKNHFLKGIDLLKNSVDEKLEAELETTLAIIENICGNLDVSKEHFYKALHTFEKLNERKRIAELNHNIGMLYLELEEYEKAVNEFDKGIDVATKGNFKTILSISYLGKANALLYLEDYHNTAEYCYKAMDIAINIEDKLTIADVYKVMGILERKLNHYNTSESYFQISLRLNKELGNKLNSAESAYEIALLYDDLNNDEQKTFWLNGSLKYYKNINAAEKINLIEKMLEPAI
jgi:tetratricopeptide (TPR) repeat protein